MLEGDAVRVLDALNESMKILGYIGVIGGVIAWWFYGWGLLLLLAGVACFIGSAISVWLMLNWPHEKDKP